MADKNNLEEPLQNNIPEPFQNNQDINQYKLPEPYQDNQIPNINYIPGPDNQGIINIELNQKIKYFKIIFCIIMTIIFIAEITLEITALPSIRKAQKYKRGSFFYVSLTAIYSTFIYPPLILFSLGILIISFFGKNPTPKIIGSIVLCFIRGLIIINFFREDSKKVKKFGIVLEILNGFLMITSVSYQILLLKSMKN